MPVFNCLQCGREKYNKDRKVKLCSFTCAGLWRKANHLTRHVISLEDRLWGKVDKSGEHWLFDHPNRYGYGRIGTGKIKESGSVETVTVHRLAWELRTGEPVPEGLDVLHTCDVRNCIRNDDEGVYVVRGEEFLRYGHLWLGTSALNTADAAQKGRMKSGTTKLTIEQAREIKDLLRQGVASPRTIAAKYDVSPPTIFNIRAGRIWKHA